MPNPISSGLQSSAASEAAVSLNQTNYANIDTVASGISANLRIYGKAGPTTQYPAVRGSVETILPSATIINVPFNSTQIVGYDGEDYMVRGTLPEVFADGVTPTGAVSVVGGGTPRLPSITPIVSSGFIIGYQIVDGGSGATTQYTLTFGSVGSGAGAVPGAQTITNGVIVAIAPGNPGNGHYSSGTTVSASGGILSGAAGGGRNIGGNGGRLITNDGTTGSSQ